MFAVIAVFTIYNVAAVIAGYAIPVFKCYIRAVRAVGIEDT